MGVDSAQWKNVPGAGIEEPPPETRPFPAAPTAGVVTQGGCQVCGRGAAQWFTVRRHVGMLLLQKIYKANALLCIDNAIRVVKQDLEKTLVQRGWGDSICFVNIVEV